MIFWVILIWFGGWIMGQSADIYGDAAGLCVTLGATFMASSVYLRKVKK